MREMFGLARVHLAARVLVEGLVFLVFLGSLVTLLWLVSPA